MTGTNRLQILCTMKILALFLLALPLLAAGQVQKCKINGQVVYSDSLCGTSGQTIDTSANTIDSSGLRKEAQRQREEAELAEITANTPRECRFKFYRFGDSTGKALSDNAKRECIQNILAVKQGRPITKEAYNRWKDHFDQTSADRRSAADRASAATNAATIARSNRDAIDAVGRKLDDPLKCTSDRSVITSSVTCKR